MTKFDTTLRPQDDFFGYVNNNWIKDNPIPPNESIWGTFYELRDKSAEAIKEIVDELAKQSDDSLTHNQKLIKTFFLSSLNFDKNQTNHIKTLNEELSKIGRISNQKQLAYYLGAAHRKGFTPFWIDYVSIDDKNSQIQALRFHQGGLSLPNRDYYLDKSPRMQNIRKKYQSLFESVHKELSPHIGIINWANVINTEILIAKTSFTDIKLRDLKKNYNHFTIKQLQSRLPEFDWLEYFKGYKWTNINDNIIIDQLPFINGVLNFINQSGLDTIKDYVRWQIINDSLEWINAKTAKINFEFYGKVIGGKPQDHPTWKRAILQVEDLIIGEALGKEYASRHFPESSKQEVLEIVDDVRKAYHKRIDQVTWMTEKTKQKAHRKLDNTRTLIGYPSKWHNLDKLFLADDNHIANFIALNELRSDIEIAKIGKKPPHENWLMNAHTVNAYYEPSQLIICFPAGILQPPFYDPNASYASNLGGIGSVIGHELTHGFDDQGSEFDEFGNAKNWISANEQKLFKDMAKGIVKQADSYEAMPGLFLKGKLVLGEAIADIGGIELAIEALKAKQSDDLEKSIRELLVSYVIFERGSQREEHLIRQVKTDPHPPSKFRVNCTMMHINDFYDVFDVKPTDKLYLPDEDRIHIW